MKYSLLDVVALAESIPEDGLVVGMIGSIIDIYTTPEEAYEVEFCDLQGRTIAQRAFLPDQLLPVEP